MFGPTWKDEEPYDPAVRCQFEGCTQRHPTGSKGNQQGKLKYVYIVAYCSKHRPNMFERDYIDPNGPERDEHGWLVTLSSIGFGEGPFE